MLVLPNYLAWLSVARLHVGPFPSEQEVGRRGIGAAVECFGFVGGEFLEGLLPFLDGGEGNVVLDDVFLVVVLVQHQFLVNLVDLLPM